MIWNDLKNRSKKCTVTFVGANDTRTDSCIKFYIENTEYCAGTMFSETVTVDTGTVIRCVITPDGWSTAGRVKLNGAIVKSGNHGQPIIYEHIITQYTEIIRAYDSTRFPNEFVVNIMER